MKAKRKDYFHGSTSTYREVSADFESPFTVTKLSHYQTEKGIKIENLSADCTYRCRQPVIASQGYLVDPQRFTV